MNDTKTTTLSALRQRTEAPAVTMGFGNAASFELMQRAAKLLQASTIVPEAYRGNLSDCVVALNMANRMNADPLMVMQNLVIVNGQPTWSAKFLIATVNACGRFSSLRYDFFGERDTDGWGCRAWAIEKATGEKLVGTDITIGLAKLEGWYGRKGSKWQTIPQQMLMYRAASWWVRTYAPELSMGLQTSDEAVDVIDVNPDGSYTVTTESLRAAPAQAAPAEVIDPDTGEVTQKQAQEPKKPEQEQRKSRAKKPEPEQPELVEAAPEPEEDESFSFAQVNDLIAKARTADELDEAADCIRFVQNEQHREALTKFYTERKKSFN